MKAIKTLVHFNEKGEITTPDLPDIKNQIERLSLAEKTEDEDWYNLSSHGLARAYNEDEPEYTMDMLKERDSCYKHE